MVENIKKLASLKPLKDSTTLKEINGTLPVKIKVLSKLYGMKYMMKIGNLETVTKSLKELDIGRSYWAVMQKNTLGSITLSNLTPQPKILEFSKFFTMELKIVKEVFENSKGSPLSSFKQEVLTKLANSLNRDEFWFWTNVLLSMQQGVYTLPFRYDKKEHLLQLRKMASKEILNFYAIFPNLGEIDGVIKQFQDELFLELGVQFLSVKQALLQSVDELKGVIVSKIEVKKNITPLYEFNNALLDLKG